MRLYYYRDPVGNVGDDLNLWLWPELLPDIFDYDDGRLFLGIGTLINHRVPSCPPKVVFGAGVGYGRPPALDATWTVHALRGPLSASALGVDASLGISDPGLLIRRLRWPDETKRHRISFIPHHTSAKRGDWETGCRLAGVHYIDPRWSVPRVVRDIKRSEVVVSEAMHGAILADALRVPWVAARFHEGVDTFKWCDWCASVGVEYRPVSPRSLIDRAPGWRAKIRRRLAPYTVAERLEAMVRSAEPELSTDGALARAEDRLMEGLEALRRTL